MRFAVLASTLAFGVYATAFAIPLSAGGTDLIEGPSQHLSQDYPSTNEARNVNDELIRRSDTLESRVSNEPTFAITKRATGGSSRPQRQNGQMNSGSQRGRHPQGNWQPSTPQTPTAQYPGASYGHPQPGGMSYGHPQAGRAPSSHPQQGRSAFPYVPSSPPPRSEPPVIPHLPSSPPPRIDRSMFPYVPATPPPSSEPPVIPHFPPSAPPRIDRSMFPYVPPSPPPRTEPPVIPHLPHNSPPQFDRSMFPYVPATPPPSSEPPVIPGQRFSRGGRFFRIFVKVVAITCQICFIFDELQLYVRKNNVALAGSAIVGPGRHVAHRRSDWES
ncbi:hypothetical protein K474DRAFT_1679625 [Panus rudis PR-1116 ss-1]|nr:hypothetical protein K474DRAFT_1679625 [Panus rudis PR-1116 ss-1]